MKRSLFVISVIFLLVLVLSLPVLAAPGNTFPDIIDLPIGFRPEGIAVGQGHEFFTGSLGNGTIYKGNLRTGDGGILVPGAGGRVAVGMAVDQRSNALFVAGGATGTATVYDAGTGAQLAMYQLAAPDTGFVNDVIVTRKAAYFTNSGQPVMYKIPLGAQGSLPDPAEVETIPLSGDFVFVPGFNSNGIEASSNGKMLVIVHSSRGELYRVDPDSGQTWLIDLGGESVPFGDGLLLDENILYVVQNRLNQIAVFQMDESLTSGALLDIITNPAFRVPTTIAGFGDSLYAVNARFGTPDPDNADYDVVRSPKLP